MPRSRLLTQFATLAAGTALAATAALAPSAAFASEGDGPLTPTTSAIGGETERDAANRAKLQELATTQSVEDIQRILASGMPVVALYDFTTHTYLAVMFDDPFSVSEISPRGPGCATTDACATGNSNYGYYGTGQLNINLTGITKIFSGDHATTWWQGAQGVYQNPNVTLLFQAPGATLSSITRS